MDTETVLRIISTLSGAIVGYHTFGRPLDYVPLLLGAVIASLAIYGLATL